MKNFFASAVIIVSLVFPIGVLAHVTQSDGQISVLMHIDPDDDPILNRPANLFFEVTDASKKFTAENCNCSLTIKNGASVLFSGPLSKLGSAPSIYSFEKFFTFTTKAVYTIGMSGQPKILGAFQSFNVSYSQRVTRTNALPTAAVLVHLTHIDHLAHIVIFGGGFAVALYFIIKERKKLKLQAAAKK